MNNDAMVIFSGGQDSTTCLMWALSKFNKISAVTFNYKQRHQIEVECAKNIITLLNSDYLGRFPSLNKNQIIEHSVIDISFLSEVLSSAMIQKLEMKIDDKTQLPSTFVPGRNILFLTLSAAIAYQKSIQHLVIGVCQNDFSDYPDCRDVTIKATQVALRLGLDSDIVIHTPLMWKNKKETIELMQRYGDIELFKYTHTCYNGERPACGECDACISRLNGFKDFGLDDPLEYR